MGLRKIKKNVAENKFIFPLEMYTSLPGSIIVTSYILSNDKPDVKEIRKKWKHYLRHGFDFDFSDRTISRKCVNCLRWKCFLLSMLHSFSQSLMLLSALTLKLRKAERTFYHSGKTVITQEL